MDEVEPEGTEATSLFPVSRTTVIPEEPGACDDPPRPGDLSLGDVTSEESGEKHKNHFRRQRQL